jgi:hypothetical protein
MRRVCVLSMVVLVGTAILNADGVALRAIQALDARGRTEHERMLEDTQSLADEIGSLTQENAERIADIATLKAEIAALRAEVAALDVSYPWNLRRSDCSIAGFRRNKPAGGGGPEPYRRHDDPMAIKLRWAALTPSR